MSSVLEKEIALEAQPKGWHAPGFFSALLFNRYFLYLVSIVVFLAVWHWAAVGSRFASYMPTPAQVLSELTRIAGDRLAGKSLWGHLWASLHRVLIGFAIAIAIGVPAGLLMALNRYVNAFVKPLFDLIKPMPPISWISLFDPLVRHRGGIQGSKPAMILGGMVVIAVTAYLLTVILTKAEQVICPWKTDLSQ